MKTHIHISTNLRCLGIGNFILVFFIFQLSFIQNIAGQSRPGIDHRRIDASDVSAAFTVTQEDAMSSSCAAVFFENIGDLTGDCYSSLPSDISGDGKRVALSSYADDPDVPDDGGTCDDFIWPHSNQAAGWTRPCSGQTFFPGQGAPGLQGFGYWEGDQTHSESLAFGISPDGKVVVGYSNYSPDNNVLAVVYSANGIQSLAIVDAGCIAHDVCDARLNISGGFTTQRMRGRVIVGYSNIHNTYAKQAPGAKALYWYNWNLVGELPVPELLPNGYAVISSEAVCISDDGQFIGGNLYYNQKANPRHYMSYPCIWKFNKSNPSHQQYDLLCVLNDLPGGDVNAAVRSISGNGNILVGYGSESFGDPDCWDNTTTPCRWKITTTGNSSVCSGPFMLTPLTGFVSGAANGVNYDGSAVVGAFVNTSGPCASPEFDVRPVRWLNPHFNNPPQNIAELMASYIPEGWMLFDAIKVSGNGKIVTGYGIDYDYNVVGWVAGLPSTEGMSSATTARSAITGSEGGTRVSGHTADGRLQQNQPNPFSGKTIIYLETPSDCGSANLIVTYAATGVSVLNLPVPCTETEIELDAVDFPAGSYFYSLTVNGALIDVRKMIILK